MRQHQATQARDAGNASGVWMPPTATPATRVSAPPQPTAVSLEIAPTVHAARIARLAVTRALLGEAGAPLRPMQPGHAAAIDTVVLLTDELVTNAAVHAGSICRLEIVVGEDAVTVSVFDASSVVPVQRREVALESPETPESSGGEGDGIDIAILAEGGRGLRLVELLATTWGVEPLSEGKRVWFSASLHRDGD